MALPWVGHMHILLVVFLWKTLTNTHLQQVPWDSMACREAASSFYADPTTSASRTTGRGREEAQELNHTENHFPASRVCAHTTRELKQRCRGQERTNDFRED